MSTFTSFAIPPAYAPWIALAIVLAMFVGFARERRPPEATAAGGAAVMIALGFIDVETALTAFSNPAPITIAALFVLTGALLRTGTIGAASNAVAGLAETRPMLAVIALLGGAMAASAFVNNTPLVLVLIPVVIRLSQKIGIASTRLLMPLSFGCVLGGATTLIGTSTNLLVDGVAQANGLAGFGVFEIAPVGIVAALAGVAYMALVGRHLLPDRQAMSDVAARADAPMFLAELHVPEDSPAIGRTAAEIAELQHGGLRVLAIRRGGRRHVADRAEMALEKGDRIDVAAPAAEVLTLHEGDVFALGRPRPPGDSEGMVVTRALVVQDRGRLRRPLGELRLPQRWRVAPLAVHRHRGFPGGRLDGVSLAGGDTVMLLGAPEALAPLFEDGRFADLGAPDARPFRRDRAPIAIAAVVAVVGLAAVQAMPIAGLALIAAAAIILTRCLDVRDAMASIDSGILLLIFSMLVVGRGLEETGAVAMVVGAATPFIAHAHPVVAIAALYALSSLLTETVTNNAVAVVVTPVAIGLALALGLDPRPFVVAVMFGASASFATPIGYQTNTLVYGAGDYRFSDFVKVGLPMNIVVGAAAVFGIWLFMM